MARARLLSVAVAGGLALGVSHGGTGPERPHLARVVLWAWERHEDLRFIDRERVGVAFLAATVRLDGARSSVKLRSHPLLVPKGTALTAVVRIEVRPGAELSGAQRNECVATLLRCARLPDVRGIQVDFDARLSERGFYRELLTELRQQLPGAIPLSVTALASWCLDDPWISSLPVDEAVPMLFAMGPSGPSIRERLASGEAFHVEPCRQSVGVSLGDAPLTGLRRPARFYVFSRGSWSPETARQAVLLATGE